MKLGLPAYAWEAYFVGENDVFERLSPWIQEYIYRQGWSELRPVQLAAAQVLLENEEHLLLSSGTATGKTEAAFLPVLTQLSKQPSKSVGILYISPLKALINDQFVRLKPLLEQNGIPVTKWHGDAPATQKNHLLRSPAGLLQITPESLQSLLLSREKDCIKLFCDLRFVIIDEVHHFMQSERGLQLQCLLLQIERLTGCRPRRIGLSATLYDAEGACLWLGAGTDRACLHPKVQEEKRQLLLHMRYFISGQTELEDTLYQHTRGKKTIIFTKSRLEAELAVVALKKAAARHKTPDIYRVHHGSVSAALRKQAENEMKRSQQPLVTAATVTLELGLDIGDLDQVVQLGAPVSASSFTQRIGRCGRQGQTAQLLFLIEGATETPVGPLANIDWEFIKAIAILQLYLEQRWVEPTPPRRQPFGLLYHQVMCAVMTAGEIAPAKLAQQLLTLPAFAQIVQDDLRTLLRHLLEIDHLRRSETGGLLLGFAAEPIVAGRDFLSVFTAPEEYQVCVKDAKIGTVNQLYKPGERFLLAGRSWVTLQLDEARRQITAAPAKGEAETKWESSVCGHLHAHLLARMRQVLVSNEEYVYLDMQSRAALKNMRSVAGSLPPIISAHGRCALFTWLSTPALRALQLALRGQGITAHIMPGGFTPVYLDCERCSEQKLRYVLQTLRIEGIDPNRLSVSSKTKPPGKFDRFLPKQLLHKQVIEECLDVQGAVEFLHTFV